MIYNRSTIGPHVKEHMLWKYGKTLKSASSVLGVGVSYLSAVITGRQPPSDKILSDMGLKKVTFYIPKDES